MQGHSPLLPSPWSLGKMFPIWMSESADMSFTISAVENVRLTLFLNTEAKRSWFVLACPIKGVLVFWNKFSLERRISQASGSILPLPFLPCPFNQLLGCGTNWSSHPGTKIT